MMYYNNYDYRDEEVKPTNNSVFIKLVHIVIYLALATIVIAVLTMAMKQAIKTQKRDAAYINKYVTPVVDGELKTFKSNRALSKLEHEKKKYDLGVISIEAYNHKKDSLAKFIE